MDGTERYTAANLQVYMLRCIAEMSTGLGIDPKRLCMGLGFDAADLSNPECRLSFRQASAMIRRAIEMVPSRALGLEIGTSETIASIGMVGYAMLTSPTLGEAVALGIKMQHLAGGMMNFDLVHSDTAMSIHATNRFYEPDIQMFLVEEAFGSFMKVGQALVGEQFKPTSIDLIYPQPEYASEYTRVFKCPIRFGQRDNVFACDAVWASKPIATYDPLSHRQALEFLHLMEAQENPEVELLESIERIVRRDMRTVLTLQQVAAQLCMSERTLRRRLADSGVSYQTMLDNIRRTRSLALLGNPRLSIEEVAYEVGFSDSHNFRRAFRRWTGRGPRESA